MLSVLLRFYLRNKYETISRSRLAVKLNLDLQQPRDLLAILWIVKLPLNVLPCAIIACVNSANTTHGFTSPKLIFGHTCLLMPRQLNRKELSDEVQDSSSYLIPSYRLVSATASRKTKSCIRNSGFVKRIWGF